MKKIILVTLLLSLGVSVYGATEEIGMPEISFSEILEKVFNILFWTTMTISAIFFLVGAYYILTSLGKTDKIKKGWTTITYTAIGIVLAILSKGIALFIRKAFNVDL